MRHFSLPNVFRLYILYFRRPFREELDLIYLTIMNYIYYIAFVFIRLYYLYSYYYTHSMCRVYKYKTTWKKSLLEHFLHFEIQYEQFLININKIVN